MIFLLRSVKNYIRFDCSIECVFWLSISKFTVAFMPLFSLPILLSALPNFTISHLYIITIPTNSRCWKVMKRNLLS